MALGRARVSRSDVRRWRGRRGHCRAREVGRRSAGRAVPRCAAGRGSGERRAVWPGVHVGTAGTWEQGRAGPRRQAVMAVLRASGEGGTQAAGGTACGASTRCACARVVARPRVSVCSWGWRRDGSAAELRLDALRACGAGRGRGARGAGRAAVRRAVCSAREGEVGRGVRAERLRGGGQGARVRMAGRGGGGVARARGPGAAAG